MQMLSASLLLNQTVQSGRGQTHETRGDDLLSYNVTSVYFAVVSFPDHLEMGLILQHHNHVYPCLSGCFSTTLIGFPLKISRL